jgi:plastocyanin
LPARPNPITPGAGTAIDGPTDEGGDMVRRGVKVMMVTAPAMALALVVAGCGGGSDNGSANGGGGAYGGSPATTTSAAPATTAAAAPAAAGGMDVAGKSLVDITMQDDMFVPSVLDGTPGQTVMLKLKNTGTQEHNFTLESQKVDTDVESGESATVKVTFPASGTLQFFCEYHKSLGMTGSLDVPAS